MKTMFLMLIGFVFVTTLVFGVLVWKQTYKIQMRALEAKRLQEEHMRKLGLANELELEMQAMAKERQEYESQVGSYEPLNRDDSDFSEA